MQTFLPFPNYAYSAQLLDYKRLGKQRVEGRQIADAIYKVRTHYNLWTPVRGEVWSAMCRAVNRERKAEGERQWGWIDHSCTRMWINNYAALNLYTDTCIKEWVRRGYNNTMHLVLPDNDGDWLHEIEQPSWLGRGDVHASHRAALLHKDPEFYSQYEWDEQPILDYVWPSP